MKGYVGVTIRFENGEQQAIKTVIPFESTAFQDALVPIDHYDGVGHPMTRMFCTDERVKRERTVSRDEFIEECKQVFGKCLREHLDSNDTLMGYEIKKQEEKR